MRELPVGLRRYLWFLHAACLGVLLAQLGGLLLGGWPSGDRATLLWAAAVFVVLAYSGERILLQVNAAVSQNLATPVHIAAILLFPPPFPLVITLLAAAASEARRRGSPLHRRAFNAVHPALAVGLSGAVCAYIKPPTQLLHSGHLATAVPGLLALILSFYLIDVGLMLGVLVLQQRRSPWHIWHTAYRQSVVPELAAGSMGIMAAILWQYDPLALLLAVLPVVALRLSFSAIAQAVDRAQALRRRGEQLEAILATGQHLRVHHGQASILQQVADAATKITGAGTVTGYLPDEEDPARLKRVVVAPETGAYAGPIYLPILAMAAAGDQDSTGEVRVLLTPDDSTVLGLLLLSGFSAGMHADSSDTLAILAQQAAIALQNADLHERALAQASQDGLTGLLNHRAFQMRLAEEVTRAQRGEHPLTLLMVDLDDFGAVNNVHGHQMGDMALRALTAALQGAVRSIDVCARYGGDEFVVILPETNAEHALRVASRVREAIANCLIGEVGAAVQLTASIGLASYPQHAQTREDLIRIADQAAYAAKNAGKNRVGRPEDALLALERDAAAITSQLEHANMATVEALAAAVDAKDPYTRGHSQRVSAYATALAGALGLPLRDVMRVQLAGLLHDVGKIGVPDAILAKSGKLTAEEFAVIQQHPEIGERMLAAVPFLREILPAIRHHHERWDGRGYPDGLSGSEIPAEATILAVADSLDAMTSSRTYRPALPLGEARRRIAEGIGTQFHPQVVAAFERALTEGTLTLLTDAPKVVPMPGGMLPGEGSGSLAAPRTLRLLVGGH